MPGCDCPGCDYVDRPSPNHDARPPEAGIDLLMVHYTGMLTADAALARLCNPASQVSAHYTIDEDGTVYRHVPEARRAWHAGVSCWAGVTDLNARSIGIELVNPGHAWGYRPFRAPQIAALITLGQAIVRRHHIPATRVLAHSDVAPARKQDPGELFPWRSLADAGLGLWPAELDAPTNTSPADPLPSLEGLTARLRRIGYCVGPPNDLPTVLMAFQRRYHPTAVTGTCDAETARRVAVVAALARAPTDRAPS